MQSYTLTNLLVTLELVISDRKTEISSYIKCHIRLNIDSKQIFNELCGIYGPQTISVRQFLGGLKLLKLGNFLLKMTPVLEG